MELHFPGRATSLDQLGPGACFLMAGPDGADLALVVTRDGLRGVLVLNRRHADGRHLPHATDVAADFDVLELREAHLVPSRAITDLAFGRVTAAAAFPALHLGDGSAYLCGRDEAGRATTFDIGSGVASAVDPAYLPRSTRWRVMVPEAGGLATVFEAGPA